MQHSRMCMCASACMCLHRGFFPDFGILHEKSIFLFIQLRKTLKVCFFARIYYFLGAVQHQIESQNKCEILRTDVASQAMSYAIHPNITQFKIFD